MFTFGTDPEFMLVDKNSTFRSAIGILPVKNNKISMSGNSFYYDNVLAECTIAPAKSKQEAVENIYNAFKDIKKIIGPYGLKLHIKPAALYADSEMQHPDAREAACKQESCAYKLEKIKPKEVQEKFKTSNLRTAGGHIHLGTELGKWHSTSVMLTRMMDLFIGLPSLLINNDPLNHIRRTLYGQPGRYRQPSHGLEYRTPGNFWLSSPELVELIYDLSQFTINFVQNNGHELFWEVDEETLNSDEFWNEYGDPTLCHHCHSYDVEKLQSLFYLQNHETIAKEGQELFDLIYNYLPDNLVSEIETHIKLDIKKDLFEEWEL